ncbi:hypothetical protein AB0D14_38750 [Streptomyces sp. NPDC048484]
MIDVPGKLSALLDQIATDSATTNNGENTSLPNRIARPAVYNGE